jgi:ATP-binding cassette subfamily B protein
MKNISNIIKLAKPLHGLVAILALLITFGAALELVAPIVSKGIVDQIVARVQGNGGDVNTLVTLVLAAFGVNLLGLVAQTASNRLGDHFSAKLGKFLTEKYYDKVLRLPLNYFNSEVSGKIVNQLNRGIVSIQGFIQTMTNFALPSLLQAIFTIIVLAYYNIPIAIFTFLLFPVYIAISYYSTKKWGEAEVKKNKIEDASRGRIQEVIGNIRLVKSFITEKLEYTKVVKNYENINTIYAKQSQTFHVFDFFRGLSLNVVLLVINIVVFYNTFQGDLTIGEMVLILQLVAQSRRPLFAMSYILTNIQRAESGSKEYFEVLKLESAEDYTTPIKRDILENPTINFDNVSFSYEKGDKVLQNVSFDISPNETVALVGHSGAGKSTIVNMILKFYNPTKGNISLNGVNYSELDHQYIRNNISLVFQDNELFSSTIRENVAYGTADATDEDVIDALKKAYAYEFVQKLPQGIESLVGERGVKLSGGQKQRIQIARAILKNAPILIMDEATSSLDAKSEKEVQNALENLMKDKLVIIIAHRFSTIQNVHKIIVVDGGKIVDYGSPQSLSKKKGIYSDLLNYQIEGNKKLLENFEIY